MIKIAATVLCAFVPALAWAQSEPRTAEPPDARQVHWQRSLDDALALAQTTGMPLLLAVNMDGESASDRIVHEEYVDPAFVALTRHCVCLGASVFRHNARDHDDEGRRIPCPRFGEITCGEHMTLEPQLWEKYLSDGERVAPRHALVRADGTKAFDLSLCFDLRDIDQALAAAVADLPVAPPLPSALADDWAALAARRDARGRATLEAAVARAPHDAARRAACAAIARHGDRGALEALRLLAARAEATDELDAALRATAAALHLEPDLDAVAADLLRRLGPLPAIDATPAQRAAVRLLGAAPADANLAAACAATGLLPNPATGRTADLGALLQLAADVARTADTLPRPGVVADAMPPAEELRDLLDRLDHTPADARDAAWHASFAKASLDLARRGIETGAADTQVLLEDAVRSYDEALRREPGRADWWIERTRTAYFRQQFAAESEFGRRALGAATGDPALPRAVPGPALESALAVEALRWIADGEARRTDVSAAAIADALTAFGLAAASAFGSEQDWVSFASYTAAVGLHREAVAIALAGARRYPAANALRQELNAALWRCGRPDLAPAVADDLMRAHASADAAWHAAYAHVLAAEDARRGEAPRTAIAHYEAASARLAAAVQQAATQLGPELSDDAMRRFQGYRDSCAYYQAIAALGIAMAFAQLGDQQSCADALPHAVAARHDLADVKDGLGCDVLDVVDRAIEWRVAGPSPVDARAMFAAVDKLAPTTPLYAAAIGDALLREALRADGRNPVRRERRTVDAGGNPITMPMGLPNAEGDGYLAGAIEFARIAAARAATSADKVPLAQALTIRAERALELGTTAGVQQALAEAAPLLDLQAPEADADEATLRALTAELRGRLGEARPRWRDGR